MTQKEYHISWEKILGDAKKLADKIKDKGDFHGLIAITRGGLVPAGLIAQELEIKKIETIGISSYETSAVTERDEEYREYEITKEMQGVGDGEGWLVVDDLVDSGQTAKVVKELAPKALYCVLYAKPQGEEQADLFVERVEQGTWVFFPWEKYD